MARISGTDLQKHGLAAVQCALTKSSEVGICVDGEVRFVIVDAARYEDLRGFELDAALALSRADVAAGRFEDVSAAEHVAKLSASLDSAG